MPACPRCKRIVKTPTKTFTNLSDSDHKGGLLQQAVGIYTCKCGENFPYVYGRQRLKIVPVAELDQLRKALSDVEAEKQSLQERLKAFEAEASRLEAEVARLQKSMVLSLEGRLDALRQDVSGLTSEKKKLEERIAQMPV